MLEDDIIKWARKQMEERHDIGLQYSRKYRETLDRRDLVEMAKYFGQADAFQEIIDYLRFRISISKSSPAKLWFEGMK